MKKYKGTAMIEMAYMMPVILFTWMMIIFLLFYYHDKNILSGAAYETAVVGSEIFHEEEEVDPGILGTYFQKRIHNKLLYFAGADVAVKTNDKEIRVQVNAQGKRLKVSLEQRAYLTIPEKQIRKVKVWKDRVEGVIE